ncbi:MAG: hypothetical protein WKG06_37345 [Segetibacter sp.]
MRFNAAFVLPIFAMGIIACNSTTQGKKDEKELNAVEDSSTAVKYRCGYECHKNACSNGSCS